jgi:hypothetical protein
MASARRTTLPKARAKTRRSLAIELSWGAFMKCQAHAHLLMGVFDLDEELVSGTRARLALLRALARVLVRRGNYAVNLLRNLDGGDLAMMGLQDRGDADRIAQALRARKAPRFGPWLSHRSFTIDAAAYRRIEAALLVA